jgi:hypothetical protein
MAAEHLAALDGGVVVMEIAVDASFCCGTFFSPSDITTHYGRP